MPYLDFLASGGVKEVYFDILFTEEEEHLPAIKHLLMK